MNVYIGIVVVLVVGVIFYFVKKKKSASGNVPVVFKPDGPSHDHPEVTPNPGDVYHKTLTP